MKKGILIAVLTVTLLAGAGGRANTGEITITWFGHACFLVTTSSGTEILIDPVVFKGYRVPDGVTADVVTVSHEHPDHNSVDAVSGNPVVLRGCDKRNRSVTEINRTIEDVKIYTVPSYHDPGGHGMNAVFVFEFDDIRLVHLGDIGTILTDAQIDAIGRVDVLMIPVGGLHTIGIAKADSIVDQLAVTSVVLPMHYKTEAFDSLPYTADSYVEGKRNVKRIAAGVFTLDVSAMPVKREYVVLDYR